MQYLKKLSQLELGKGTGKKSKTGLLDLLVDAEIFIIKLVVNYLPYSSEFFLFKLLNQKWKNIGEQNEYFRKDLELKLATLWFLNYYQGYKSYMILECNFEFFILACLLETETDEKIIAEKIISYYHTYLSNETDNSKRGGITLYNTRIVKDLVQEGKISNKIYQTLRIMCAGIMMSNVKEELLKPPKYNKKKNKVISRFGYYLEKADNDYEQGFVSIFQSLYHVNPTYWQNVVWGTPTVDNVGEVFITDSSVVKNISELLIQIPQARD